MEEKNITIIASDLLGAEKAQKVVRSMQANCRVLFASLEDLPRVAKSQVEQGARVLIAFGMFAKIVRQSVDVPVIMVDLRPEDVLDGIQQAAELGKRVAIVGFRKVLRDVFRIRRLLSVELVDIPTVMPEKMPDVLKILRPDDVLVAGYYQLQVAKPLGIRTVLVKPRDEEIAKAISMARSYLEQKQDAAEENAPLLESSVYASLTVDCAGNIVMMNRLAAEYLGVSQLTAVSFSMEEVCPQFTRITDVITKRQAYLNQIARIEDKIFLYHAEPMFRGQELEGVMVIFQDVNTVLGAEASIRRKLTEKANRAQYTLDSIHGHSPCMTQVLKLALKYSKADETVLILGETGVGKELFAQGIHRASGRKDGPFVAVNCASLPETILESELFGYVKGAFTGADRDGKRGLFENAHTGTIFLDEIGEISLALQGKLLRVLQEHSIRRVRGEKPIPVDIRVIAATNRDLVAMVREGTFRSDLYFRLNVLELQIPPLRQRRQDIVLLAEEFLEEASLRDSRDYRFSPEAKAAMLRYRWPGNIRELQNLVRRVTVISDSAKIGEDLVEAYIRENIGLCPTEEQEKGPFYTLEEAMALAGNNKKRAAEILGVSRTTLYRMLERKES